MNARRTFLQKAALTGIASIAGIGNYSIHAKNIKKTTRENGENDMKSWRFVHVTDIHVGSPRSYRFAPAWKENWETARKQIIECNPDLLLIGGDMTRDGSFHTFELENIKADLDSLPFPYFVVPGNMDTGNKCTTVSGLQDDVRLNVTSENLTHFSSVFGSNHWSFVHKGIRFSGFCSMTAGSGLPEEQELWNWIESLRELPQESRHVWISHMPLFINNPDEPSFDITNTDQYMQWHMGMDETPRKRILKILHDTGADIFISGHVHCRREYFADGIRFDYAPSTAFPGSFIDWKDGDPSLGFIQYDVNDSEITPMFIAIESISTAQGYGPGGHPRPEERDYSKVWEK